MYLPYLLSFAVLLGLAPVSSSLALETRSYVIGWFGQATMSQEGDCPAGVHQEVEYQFLDNLAPLGYSKDEIETFRQDLLAGDMMELMMIMGTRGRVDGQAVNPYTNPATVADPNLSALEGAFAYGFDLDDRGAVPGSFTDPETGESGIDHQLYRALGCARSFRGSLAGRPTYWDWAWGQTRDAQPAWLLTITTDDSGPGPGHSASLRLERAIEHLASNSDGSPTSHISYRVDPDPRSHNEFGAEVRGGMLYVTEHKTLRMLQNPLVAPEFELRDTHLRIQTNDDGTIRGFVGGYQPWAPIYFGFAGLGIGGEQMVTGDIPALYYLLRKHADAEPDPETGINNSISATYYFEAVPAFIIRDEMGKDAMAAPAQGAK